MRKDVTFSSEGADLRGWVYVPDSGPPWPLVVMAHGFSVIEYGGRFGTRWVNDLTRAQPKTPVAWHPGLCARHISCPSLFVVSPQDEMPGSKPAVARDAFEKLEGPKEWIEIDGGHFGLLYFPSEEFERASSAQARFLSDHLSVRRPLGQPN